MLPSPSSSPLQHALRERTNILGTPAQAKLTFGLPTPPADKRLAVITSGAESSLGLPKKRKLSFSGRGSKGGQEVLPDVDRDIKMEDVAFQPTKAPGYTPFHMGIRATMRLPGRRRENPSTWAILQSFVSSNKSDVYKCQATSDNAFLTPPYACSYTNGAKSGGIPLLAVATEQGTVHVVNTLKRRDWEDEPPQEILQIHQNGIFDAKWNADDSLLATCSGDQSTHITCINTKTPLYRLRGHSSTVKCVTWDPSNTSLLSTGGRDGGICLWDLRVAGIDNGEETTVLSPVIIIPGAHEDSTSRARRRGKKVPAPRTVTSLLYPGIGTYGLISSGSFDGIIKHWDLRVQGTKTKRAVKPKLPTNVCSSPSDPTLNGSRRPRGIVKLAAGTGPTTGLVFGLGADSRIHVYDIQSLNPLTTGYLHENMQTNSFYVGLTLSPCGRWLAAGGGASGSDTQGSAFLFDVGDAIRPSSPLCSQAGIQLKSQQGEVGAVDWAADTLATCADDGTVRAWRPDIGTYRKCMQAPEEMVGAGYSLHIVKALDRERAFVLVLTSSPSKTSIPESLNAALVKYVDIAAITRALQETTLNAEGILCQNNVAETSKGAGMKLFLPSGFVVPTEGSRLGPFVAKDKSAKHIQALGIPACRFHLQVKAAILFTSIKDIAGFMTYILANLHPLATYLDNSAFRIQGQSASLDEIATILGTSVEHVSEVLSPAFPPAGFFQEYFETGAGTTTWDAEVKEGEEKAGSSNSVEELSLAE
ncbi:hypothetical protein DXG01_007982 [Tephrocybe rancida]|nr:hypothetical protein DXG01_007982 [Tephrocybe rancida]